MARATTDGLSEETCEEIAAGIHKMIGGKTMDEHVESAEAKLEDDDLVAFQLVAVRKGGDGHQTVSQRTVSPEAVREASAEIDPEEYIEALQAKMCEVYDQEIRGE